MGLGTIYRNAQGTIYRNAQGTIYRKAQLRYTQSVYCTLWEECKQTPTEVEGKGLKLWCDITVQQKNKYLYQYIKLEGILIFGFWSILKIHPLGPFLSKKMRCPWILCFDLLQLQYTDLTHQIWRFLVYIFLGRICVIHCE